MLSPKLHSHMSDQIVQNRTHGSCRRSPGLVDRSALVLLFKQAKQVAAAGSELFTLKVAGERMLLAAASFLTVGRLTSGCRIVKEAARAFGTS